MKFGPTFGGPSPEIWRPQNMKFRRDFGQLRDLIANFSGEQHDIVNRKNGVTNYGHSRYPARANLTHLVLSLLYYFKPGLEECMTTIKQVYYLSPLVYYSHTEIFINKLQLRSVWFECETGDTEKTSYFTHKGCDTEPCDCPSPQWKKK